MLLVLEHAIGDRHFDEHLENLESQLSLAEVEQVAGPVVVAKERHVGDVVGEQTANRIDTPLAETVHAAELASDVGLLFGGVVAVGVRDFREQTRHRRHDTPSGDIGVGQVLLDNLRESIPRFGWRLVFSAKDHRLLLSAIPPGL